MTNIILCGANGKMGHVIQSVVNGRDDCKIVAGVDLNTDSSAFPVYSSFDEIKENADVIIDFSNPALLDSLLAYSKQNKVPVVIATTGYDDTQKAEIENAAKETAVFFTYNMSMGINLLATLAKRPPLFWAKSLTLRSLKSIIIRKSMLRAVQRLCWRTPYVKRSMTT